MSKKVLAKAVGPNILPLFIFGGGIPKWPTGADCKSAGATLRWFESASHHQPPDPEVKTWMNRIRGAQGRQLGIRNYISQRRDPILQPSAFLPLSVLSVLSVVNLSPFPSITITINPKTIGLQPFSSRSSIPASSIQHPKPSAFFLQPSPFFLSLSPFVPSRLGEIPSSILSILFIHVQFLIPFDHDHDHDHD